MTNTDTQELLQQAQTVEQAMHSHAAQRSTLQQQMSEIENALKELTSAPEAYRIIGNVMVKSSPEVLTNELTEKKATLTARLSSTERQEQKLREQLEKLQAQILKG